jgi:hypothetical protein
MISSETYLTLVSHGFIEPNATPVPILTAWKSDNQSSSASSVSKVYSNSGDSKAFATPSPLINLRTTKSVAYSVTIG